MSAQCAQMHIALPAVLNAIMLMPIKKGVQKSAPYKIELNIFHLHWFHQGLIREEV